MNAKQIAKVVKAAEQSSGKPMDFELAEEIFHGQQKVRALEGDLITIIRWQARLMGGEWDASELSSMCWFLTNRVILLEGGAR